MGESDFLFVMHHSLFVMVPDCTVKSERSAVKSRLLCCAVCQVMVWIHGGGLVVGAASQYDGAPLAAYENIVMVIIQYRLGILGYLR